MLTSSSYQSIREQLIALQVDLDDKSKICSVLERKIQSERALLGRIENDFNDEYQTALEKEMVEHQAAMEKLRKQSSMLMNQKKELMEMCKMHLDAVKDDEASVQEQGKRMNRETEEMLEIERKMYRASHEERLQKYLASKAGEHRELTGRALQPEFARLKLMHERELSDVETNAMADERRMRVAHQNKLEDLIREERDAFIDEQKQIARSRGDAISAELLAAEREHKIRMHALQCDSETDLEKYNTALTCKTDKERKAGQVEVRKAQESCHSRLQEIRSRHAHDMSVLLKDHNDQIKEIHKDADLSLAKLEKKLRDEEQFKRSGDGSEGRSGRDNLVDDAVKREAVEQRNKRIQTEIRTLQAESVRLERTLKAKAEAERNEISETRNREEKESTKRQRNFTEQISELAVTRETYAQDVRILNDKVLVLSSELLEGRREVEVYENGIAAHRMRLKDMENMHSSRWRDEEATSDRMLENLRARVNKMNDLLRQREKMLNQELDALEQSHVAEMENLDRQVSNISYYSVFGQNKMLQ